jgi:hypothetical protein
LDDSRQLNLEIKLLERVSISMPLLRWVFWIQPTSNFIVIYRSCSIVFITKIEWAIMVFTRIWFWIASCGS